MIKSNQTKSTKKGSNLISNIQPLISDHRGITLVALIITIIVMLILVAVSVTIAIKGDLFGIAKKASKETEKAKNKEQELANGRIKIDGIWYDSLEDYAIGKASEVQGVVDLNEKNTKFIYTPEGWTNGEVKVEINVADVAAGYSLKYSTDNINWNDYTGEIPIDANGPIYAKLVDSEGNEGGPITGNVKIDKEAPTINTNLTKAGEETDTTIPLNINVTDSQSGISKIEWYYKKSTDPESKYDENKKTDEYKTMNGKEAGERIAVTKETTLTGLTSETTYNIYAIVYDVAGNVTRNPAGTGTLDITTKKAAVKPQIGDYVKYEPDSASSYSLSSTYSGYTVDQSISQETLTWQVLKVHNDGSIDLIGTPTTGTVYFKGALGYNNGVYLLHDICKELYSKPSKGIEARSVSLEDFEDEENGGKWKVARDSYTDGIGYNNTKTYTGDYSYYPNLYAEENGSGINTTVVKTDGIKDTNKFYTSPTTENYSQANTSGLTVTQTYYSIVINETNYGATAKVLSNSNAYWLASRDIDLCGYAIFALRYARTHLGSGYLFYSYSNAIPSDYALRPVVSLGSNIQLSVVAEGTGGSTNTFKIIF